MEKCTLCSIALQSCSILCSMATNGPARCTLCSTALQSLICSLHRNGTGGQRGLEKCTLCSIALQSCSILCSIATNGPARCTLCSIALQSLICSLHRNGTGAQRGLEKCTLCSIALQSCSILCSIATNGPARCTLCSIALQSLICRLLRNGFIVGVVKRCFALWVLPVS